MKACIDQSEEQDVRRVVESQNLVFETGNDGWQKGLPLGNGSFGGIHYIRNGASCWVINHLDVIQTRCESRFGSLEEERVWYREGRAAPFRDYVRAMEQGRESEWRRRQRQQEDKFRKDYDHRREEPGDTMHPVCGRLTLKCDGCSPEPIQRLDVYNGVTQVEYIRDKFSIASFVSRAYQVQVIRIEAQSRRRLSYTLDIPVVRPNQRHPHLYTAGERCWSRYVLDSGFTYVLGGQFLDAGNLTIQRSEAGFSGHFTVQPGRPVVLLLSVATSYDAIQGSVSDQAISLLETAARAGPAAIEQEHRRWWHTFWEKSWLEIDDKVIEKLWYLGLYYLASTNGDGQKKPNLGAGGLHGMFMGADRTRWANDWFPDVDIEEAYWPCYVTNHPELAEPFIRGVQYRYELGKTVAQSDYGMHGSNPGLGFRGMCVGPWYCQHLWWHYIYTGDRQYLAGTAYPIMRDVGLFFLDFLSKDKQGRYFVYPSFSPEQGPNLNKNPTIDLALLKYLFGALIRAEAILTPGKIDPRWRRVRDRLAAYPTGVSHGRKVLRDSEKMAATRGIRHPVVLMPIFPMDEIAGSLAKNTVINISERIELVCFAQTWIAAAMARLGLGDRALRYLYDKFINFMTLENGLFYQQTPFFCQRLDLPPNAQLAAEPQSPYREASGSLVTVVGEMLMSGLGRETTEIFKGCPSAWPNARFANFLAPGGFEVSAARRRGKTQWVQIRSLQGKDCVLVNPFNTAEVRDTIRDGRRQHSTQRTLRFATEAGHTYLIVDARRLARPAARVAPGIKPSGVLSWPTRWGYCLSLGSDRDVQRRRRVDEFVYGFMLESLFVFNQPAIREHCRHRAVGRITLNLPEGGYDILEQSMTGDVGKRYQAHAGGLLKIPVHRQLQLLAVKRRPQWELANRAEIRGAPDDAAVRRIFALRRFESPWRHAFFKPNGCVDAFGLGAPDLGYAVYELYSPVRKPVLLLTHFPNPTQLWGNGRLVFETAGHHWDDRAFQLRRGWNRFVAAIKPTDSNTEFSMQVTERMDLSDTVYQLAGERSANCEIPVARSADSAFSRSELIPKRGIRLFIVRPNPV